MRYFARGLVGAVLIAAAGPSAAQDGACTFAGETWELTSDQVAVLYECIGDDLAAGYAAGGDPVGSVYRDWGVTSTAAYAPGPHGDRLLLTFANDVAYDAYVAYAAEDGFAMPVGSVLAKESFSLTDEGAPRPGPLFVMTRVAAGIADDYGGWVYAAVQPDGSEMGISQDFCSACHAAFETQDSLGYPAVEVRLDPR